MPDRSSAAIASELVKNYLSPHATANYQPDNGSGIDVVLFVPKIRFEKLVYELVTYTMLKFFLSMTGMHTMTNVLVTLLHKHCQPHLCNGFSKRV